MANPAELLHAILTRWREVNSYADTAEQMLAVRHLAALDELLNQMDGAGFKTSLYRPYYEHWVRLTLHNPHDWARQSNQRHTDDYALGNLEILADRLNDLLPGLKAGGLDQLRDYAAQATSLTDDDDSIDPLLKMHVKQVIAHVNWCIDNFDAVGEFDLQDAVQRLLGAMMNAARTTSPNGKFGERWKTFLNGFVWPFGANVASALPSQALVQLALGGG